MKPHAAERVPERPELRYKPRPTRKLRVLFLASRDIRHPANTGGDIGLWERAQYLVDAGHDVTFMASSFDGAPYREVIDGINVVRMGGLLSLWWRTFIFYMKECRGKFDVVVVEGFGGSRIPRLTPLYIRVPIITEWHQIHADLFAIQYPKLLVPILNMLERITARIHRNTIVMARTDEWRVAFPRIGFKPANIRVVPACIEESWLEGQADLARGPQIVWLGKFRRYKCPDHAIRAMREVLIHEPTARLTLAGYHDDLSYEADLRSLVERLGLEAAVNFRFGITSDEKRALLDSARALVLPSSVEGFGIVVLEANARQVPVVASSGVPTGAVAHERNGLRYPFGDIQALASAMLRIISDPDFHAELAARSFAFARLFEFRRVCGQYEAVLYEATRSRRSTDQRPAQESPISR
jgi:glycosyltransferase involved in cell wall biosynthesis